MIYHFVFLILLFNPVYVLCLVYILSCAVSYGVTGVHMFQIYEYIKSKECWAQAGRQIPKRRLPPPHNKTPSYRLTNHFHIINQKNESVYFCMDI